MSTKKAPLLQRFFRSVADSEPGNSAMMDAIGPILAEKYGAGDYTALPDEAKVALHMEHADDFNSILASMQKKPLAWEMPIEGVKGTVSPFKTLASGALGNLKAHKAATAGTALNAALNIGGLVDNDKFLGQLLGTAGGALLGAKGLEFGPLGIANTAMLAGNLGMLFDKLQAKKEQEEQYRQQQQQQQQYYGG